jgi:hypothetical protein
MTQHTDSFAANADADADADANRAAARPARRVFLMQLSACSALALAAGAAHAAPHVEEDDETAKALGYRHDNTKVDVKKYPQHTAAQKCGNCGFWQGTATDDWAGCAMFGRKQIAHNGWCAAWKKVG